MIIDVHYIGPEVCGRGICGVDTHDIYYVGVLEACISCVEGRWEYATFICLEFMF